VHQENISPTPSLNLEDLKKTTTIETIHNDEALKVLAYYGGEPEWTKKEENQLRYKIDHRLLSILSITYGFQYYDKAMLWSSCKLWHLKNSKKVNDPFQVLFGLKTDLNLDVGIDTVSPPRSSTLDSSAAHIRLFLWHRVGPLRESQQPSLSSGP
jgi:hypothetical protein